MRWMRGLLLALAVGAMLAAVAHAASAARACAREGCRPARKQCTRTYHHAKRTALALCKQEPKNARAACRQRARQTARAGIRACRESGRACDACCRNDGAPCPVAVCGNGLVEGAESCDGAATGTCPAACRTDCTCEPEPTTCGNGKLDDGEECDAALADACAFGCTPECTCSPSLCGDDLVSGDEECDGSDDWECPGQCLEDCTCPPPVCGDGVLEGDEECEPGLFHSDCAGRCLPDCTCAECGNGIIELPVEECEPGDDTACPGACSEQACVCVSPVTDVCEAPREIDAFPFLDGQSTVTATTSPTDPGIRCAITDDPDEPHGHSTWYALMAPASGLVTIDTAGSDYDTLLVAYTGTCEEPAALACNDDRSGYSGYQARIAFPIVEGERYLIEAAAFSGDPGGELRLAADFRPCGDGVLDPDEACDPGLPETCAAGTCSLFCECLGTPADECADAPLVTELPVAVSLATHYTTANASDPLTCAKQPPDPPRTTWFRFVAPANGTVEITTLGSDYDTVLALFTGECGALSQVACNDDFDQLTSYIAANVTAGVTYTLVVTPWYTMPPGRLELSIAYDEE